MLSDDLDSPPARFQLRQTGPGLGSCIPVAGPGRRLVSPVAVDDHLVWVAPVPTLPLGAARPSSPAALAGLGLRLARDLAAAQVSEAEAVAAADHLLDAAVRAVAACLAELPALPFIGEPFGGDEGTD